MKAEGRLIRPRNPRLVHLAQAGESHKVWCRKGVAEEIAGLDVDHAVESYTSIAAAQHVGCMLR